MTFFRMVSNNVGKLPYCDAIQYGGGESDKGAVGSGCCFVEADMADEEYEL